NIVIFGTRITGLPLDMDAFATFDGGTTWRDVKIDSSIDGVTSGNSLRGDPTVKFDANGRLYISYLIDGDATSNTAANTYLVVAHSTDGGKTYQAVNVVNEPKTNATFDDKKL